MTNEFYFGDFFNYEETLELEKELNQVLEDSEIES